MIGCTCLLAGSGILLTRAASGLWTGAGSNATSRTPSARTTSTPSALRVTSGAAPGRFCWQGSAAHYSRAPKGPWPSRHPRVCADATMQDRWELVDSPDRAALIPPCPFFAPLPRPAPPCQIAGSVPSLLGRKGRRHPSLGANTQAGAAAPDRWEWHHFVLGRDVTRLRIAGCHPHCAIQSARAARGHRTGISSSASPWEPLSQCREGLSPSVSQVGSLHLSCHRGSADHVRQAGH
jgi:hypothetical protein